MGGYQKLRSTFEQKKRNKSENSIYNFTFAIAWFLISLLLVLPPLDVQIGHFVLSILIEVSGRKLDQPHK